MNCIICKVKKVNSKGGRTCGLKCACELNRDDFFTIRARLSNAIAESKLACKHGTKGKINA